MHTYWVIKLNGGSGDKRKKEKKEEKRKLGYVLLLFLVFCLAFYLRQIPRHYGEIIGMDPYFHFRMVEEIVRNGHRPEIDVLSYHPEGRIVPYTSPPLLHYTIAYSYLLVGSKLGFTLKEFFILFPSILGALCVFPMYSIGKEIWSREVGLLSSFFLAVSPPHLIRTLAGFNDKESLGGLLMLVSVYLLIKSYKNCSIKYSILSGIFLGGMALTWGAFRSVFLIFSAFLFLMVLLKKLDKRGVYSVTPSLTMALVISLTSQKWRCVYMDPLVFSSLFISYLSILTYLIGKKYGKEYSRLFFLVSILAAGLVSLLIGVNLSKFYYMINPLAREKSPLFSSIAEHQPITYREWYVRTFSICFLFPLGVFLLMKRRRGEDLFLLTWFLLTIYSAASTARISFLLAPSAAVVSSIALEKLLVNLSRVREGDKSRANKEKMARYLILVLLLVGFTLPPSIIALQISYTRTPEITSEWIEALNWIKRNTPEDSVILAWWDYGYWIQTLANRRTVIDPSNLKPSRNAEISRALFSPEKEGIEVFLKYETDYVLIDRYWELRKGPPIASVGGVDFYRYFEITGEEFNVKESGKDLLYIKMICPEVFHPEYLELVRSFGEWEFCNSKGRVLIYKLRKEEIVGKQS